LDTLLECVRYEQRIISEQIAFSLYRTLELRKKPSMYSMVSVIFVLYRQRTT